LISQDSASVGLLSFDGPTKPMLVVASIGYANVIADNPAVPARPDFSPAIPLHVVAVSTVETIVTVTPVSAGQKTIRSITSGPRCFLDATTQKLSNIKTMALAASVSVSDGATVFPISLPMLVSARTKACQSTA
jgi:hypothetical protein